MVNIHEYLETLTERLRGEFGQRLRYVGLQGSYLRGEATQNSDIDVMVLLDGFSVEDMDAYRQILMELGHYDQSCGFICSVEEFQHWNKLELCHVLHTTKDYFGSLSDYISAYSREDVREFTKMSLNNLYHALCHCYIHSGQARAYEELPGLYKSTFFVLQSISYLKTGEYARTKKQLLETLEGTDREVLACAMGLGELSSEDAFRLLFDWLQRQMVTI